MPKAKELTHEQAVRKYRREAQQYKDALKKLCAAVIEFEKALDVEMKNPSSYERGKRIAKLENQLTMDNQIALHATLGYSFKQIYKMYGMKDEATQDKIDKYKTRPADNGDGA